MEIRTVSNQIKLSPIALNNLENVKMWYRQVDLFGAATGGDKPDKLLDRITLPQDHPAFISGIYPAEKKDCIGLVAGEFKTTRYPVLWIETLLIDRMWQRQHYGTHAVRLLSEYSARYRHIQRIYAAVLENNIPGRAFWTSLGFKNVRAVRETAVKEKVFIFEKVIVP